MSPNPVFDARKAAPEVISALMKSAPGLPSMLSRVLEKWIQPPHSAAGVFKDCYRPPNHNRSYCIPLKASSGKMFDSDVIVVKGGEPLLPDYERYVKWMASAPIRSAHLPIGDHFPLVEGKIPGAMTWSEAIREARISLEIQAAHLRYYGELASVPTPLFIHQFSDEENASTYKVLKEHLSAPAFDKIESALKSGLATSVYYFPHAPIRSDYFSKQAKDFLKEHMSKLPDVGTTIDRWIALFARLLHMGYLPYTPWNNNLGACMDEGNATISGGFCDLDSVVPMSEAPDDAFFVESLVGCVDFFNRSVGGFLFEFMPRSRFAMEQLMKNYLSNAIEEQLDQQKRPGLKLDPRVHVAFRPESLAQIVRCLSSREFGSPVYSP